ncbi:hypothetical protein [Microbacterium deminutum]|uniref:Lipocalin-like domain-containing protein n=1 Tax=Microbacterium deminutum TaxID=344164 RepID=A0ABN2QV38_9MICO
MNTSRAVRRIAPLALMLTLLLSACSPSPAPPLPSPSESQPSPLPTVLEALDPALVGEWGVSDWLDNTGSHALSATYRFTADGLYQYTFAECRSSTDCSILSQEQGYVESADGVLALYPQTASDDGPRSWPYRVGYLDPDIPISLELHLLNPDGTVHQILYGQS